MGQVPQGSRRNTNLKLDQSLEELSRAQTGACWLCSSTMFLSRGHFFFYRFSVSSSFNACLLLSLRGQYETKGIPCHCSVFLWLTVPALQSASWSGGSLWQLISPHLCLAGSAALPSANDWKHAFPNEENMEDLVPKLCFMFTMVFSSSLVGLNLVITKIFVFINNTFDLEKQEQFKQTQML